MRLVALLALATFALQAQVTHERLLNAAKEPQNWLTYGGGFASQRYSALTQINANNVKDLTLQWAFQQRSIEKFETTPLVVDGMMYLTQMPNDIVALDAVTGEMKWLYSYSPSREARTNLFYVNAWEGVHGLYQKTDSEFEEGKRFTGGGTVNKRSGARPGQVPNVNPEDGYGAVRALDPVTGEKKWEFKMRETSMAGILTTASDLLFTGDREGLFYGLDAKTGKQLWRVKAGGDIAMGPMTYAVNGKQYLAFAAGGSMFVYGLR